MKILFLTKYSPESFSGGVSVFIRNLVEILSNHNEIEIFVVSFGKENQMIKKDGLWIKIIKLHTIYYFLPFIPILLLLREIKSIKPNLIHIIGTNISPYIWSILFVNKKVPIVISILGVMKKEVLHENYKKRFILLLNTLNEKFFITIIPFLVVETNSIRNLFITHTKSKIFVIPSGHTIKKITAISPSINEGVDIFIAARLTQIKGIDLLIKAIAMVIDEQPELRLFIAGDGPERKNLENLVEKLKLTKNVIFLGYVDEDIKYQYYKSCKFCVIPSRWDCQPIAMFEALAFGKPVIASTAVNAEVLEIGKCGLLFESENIKDLADKIKILLENNQLRQDLGDNAQKISKLYSWNNIADEYCHLYKEVLSKYATKGFVKSHDKS